MLRYLLRIGIETRPPDFAPLPTNRIEEVHNQNISGLRLPPPSLGLKLE